MPHCLMRVPASARVKGVSVVRVDIHFSATWFCVITSFPSGVAEGNTLSVHTQF